MKQTNFCIRILCCNISMANIFPLTSFRVCFSSFVHFGERGLTMYTPVKMYNNVKKFLPQIHLRNQNMQNLQNMQNRQGVQNRQNRQGSQNMQNRKGVQNMQTQSVSPLNWFSDLDASASHGYGGADLTSFGTASCFSIDICPDLLLAAISAAAAAAGLLIYSAIVAAGKRKKREDNDFFSSTLDEFMKILGN